MILNGKTPFEWIHKYTPEIYEFLRFKWYEPVWYHDVNEPDKSNIGRWLGPTLGADQGISYRVLLKTGKVIRRLTVYPLSDTDRMNEAVTKRLSDLDTLIGGKIGNYLKSSLNSFSEDVEVDNIYSSIFEEGECDKDDIQFQEVNHEGEPIKTPFAEDFIVNDNPLCELSNEYIRIKIDMLNEGSLREGVIISQKRLNDGELIGKKHENPILDTRIYNVKFGDGTYQEYTTNILMENISLQCNNDGYNTWLLVEIVGHKALPNAIPKDKGYYNPPNGSRKHVVTTKGWLIRIKWKNGTESWISLKEIKESNPLELALYTKVHGLIDEPAFAW